MPDWQFAVVALTDAAGNTSGTASVEATANVYVVAQVRLVNVNGDPGDVPTWDPFR
jgi:hypothetical protein